jgi:hypothetical protein
MTTGINKQAQNTSRFRQTCSVTPTRYYLRKLMKNIYICEDFVIYLYNKYVSVVFAQNRSDLQMQDSMYYWEDEV